MRLLPLWVCIPYALLSPLAGQAIHLHDHDAHGLHAHVHAEFIHEFGKLEWAIIHDDAHRHSGAATTNLQEHYEFVIGLTSEAVIRVPPVVIAPWPGGTRVSPHGLLPASMPADSPALTAPIVHDRVPDSFHFAPGTRAFDALALILRAHHAILI